MREKSVSYRHKQLTLLTDEVQRRDAKWDIRSGPRNYLSLIGSQAAGSLLSFATTWLATRSLGPGGYGGVVAVLAASQMLVQIATHWSAISLSRYGCEEFVETGRLPNAFWARLLILGFSLLIVVGASPLWLTPVASLLHLPRDTRPLVLLHVLVTSLWIHVQQTLQGAKLMRTQGLLLATERAITFLGVIALVATATVSPFSVISIYILAAGAASTVGLWRLRVLIYPGITLDRSLLRQMILFSVPLVPNALVGYFSTSYIDAIFIANYLSAAALAVYAVAYQLAGMLMQLPLLGGTLLLPLFVTLQVNTKSEQVNRYIREVLPLLSLLWSTTCAVIAMLGSYLLPLIFGAEFQATSALLWPLLAASALAGPMLMGYLPFSNALATTYVTTITSVVAAIVNVGLNFLLIPRFGLLGCAWATTGAYGGAALVAVWLVHSHTRLSHTWVVQATLPAVVGAAYASWRADNVGATAAALLSSALLALIHRESIAAGFATLYNQRRFRNNA
jgi:O-antigen/teichoic acid export membrane protein